MAHIELTSRRRIERVFARQDIDRVPRDDVFWTETLERWRTEGLTGDPAAQFNFDVGLFGGVSPAPFPGRAVVVREDDQTRDIVNEYGATVREWKHRTGTPMHLANECVDADIWRDTYKPRFADAAVDLPALRDGYAIARAGERFCYLESRGTFCFIQTMVGDEVFLMAMAAEPDWVRDMAITVTDAFLRQYQMIIDAGLTPDALYYNDDLAYTHSSFMSPAMYRELFQDQHRRVADFCHQHGMKFIFHTDGDVRNLVDALLEAGADALEPLEAKANMDVRELAPRYGDRLTLVGNIDMTVAGTNDRDLIEHEVRSKLEAGMAAKCYIYHSDHSVPPAVSWQTYQFIQELLDRYGRYA
jgi:uroporphyrinogen decarboxylase